MAPIPVKSTPDVWAEYLSAYTPPSKKHIQKGQDSFVPDLEYYEIPFDNAADPSQSTGLKYTFDVYGNQPSTGYPLFIGLHGGGGGDRSKNDEDWEYFATKLYGPNIEKYTKEAVYIAARGLTRANKDDEWNLHFEKESYFLYQQLIRSLLVKSPTEATGLEAKGHHLDPNASSFVDTNRVYILGFSAGADGTYRLSTNLPDKFAAANVGGGHPGAAILSNLTNVPICLQVGQWDGDESPGGEAARNLRTAETGVKLGELQRVNSGYYTYDIFIHPTSFNKNGDDPRSHNSWVPDHLTTDPKPVINEWKNTSVWHDAGLRDAPNPGLDTQKNTCAVDWVSNRGGNSVQRNPVPNLVSWDVSPQKSNEPEPLLPTEWGSYRFNYWLAVDHKVTTAIFDALKNPLATLDIRASYDREKRYVWIEQSQVPLVILLNTTMIEDLSQPIDFYYGLDGLKQVAQQVFVSRDYQIQKATAMARGDPKLIFEAAIAFDPMTQTTKDAGSQIFGTG